MTSCTGSTFEELLGALVEARRVVAVHFEEDDE
jgi:hypothetical protein